MAKDFNPADVDREAFMSKVMPEPNSGCWLWMGTVATPRPGDVPYGITYLGRYTTLLAHRVSYALFVGALSPKSLVCHHCDNRICVNPDHLYQGSNTSNVHDMITRGRAIQPPHPTGERHHDAKLDWAKVRLIRSSASNHRQLARIYGVSESVIRNVRAERTWKNDPLRATRAEVE